MSSAVDTIQRTFVMLKPDALERRLVGEIISRLERKNLTLVKIERRNVSKELAAVHYAALTDKPFYPKLEAYVTRGPVSVDMEGYERSPSFAISSVRPTRGSPRRARFAAISDSTRRKTSFTPPTRPSRPPLKLPTSSAKTHERPHRAPNAR